MSVPGFSRSICAQCSSSALMSASTSASMVMVVGQRGIHVRKGQAWVSRYNFIRAHAPPLVVEHDVLDRNAVAVDARFPTARARGTDNPHAVLWRTRWSPRFLQPGLESLSIS